jgi:hypothetical protein
MLYAVLGLYTPSWCLYTCPEIGTSSVDCTQLSRFYLKTETIQFSKRCILKYKQDVE